MNNEEQLKQEAIAKYKTGSYPQLHPDHYAFIHGYLAGAESREKRIDELEEKISVLLSCKNCPENKGGLLCQKEYEDKCLAQKIQYIKELQEEFKNLKKTYRKQRNKRIDDLQKENTKLKTDYEVLSCSVGDFGELQDKLEEEQRKNNGLSDNLTKAKKLLKKVVADFHNMDCITVHIDKTIAEAEQFLSEVEK